MDNEQILRKVIGIGIVCLLLVIFFFLPHTVFAQDPMDNYFGAEEDNSDYWDYIRNFDDRWDPPADIYTSPWVTPATQQTGPTCPHYSAIAVLESKVLRECGSSQGMPNYSEQQLMSCGGQEHYVDALRYWEDHGAMIEWCAPVTGNHEDDSSACTALASCWQEDDRFSDYYTVDTSHFNHVKQSIFEDGPGIFYYWVYSDFVDGTSSWDFWHDAESGDVYTAGSDSTYVGQHLVEIIGWNDHKDAWLCKNSWGATDGPNGDGTFYIAYEGHEKSLHFAMANLGESDVVCDHDFIEYTVGNYDNYFDYNDNCPDVVNYDQSDMDGDLWGDVCDVDMDGDGWLNSEDNCPEIANPSQEDFDDDDIGDVCDGDMDGDGVPNGEDNCPEVPNTDQLNCDDDDPPVGDACDTDYCAYFCGAGVQSIVYDSHGSEYSAGIYTFWGTPFGEINTEYCAVGPAEETAPFEKHDVQMRWCDCDGYNTVLCEQLQCSKESPGTTSQNYFTHGSWHLISYKSGTPYVPTWPPTIIPSPPSTTSETERWYPSEECKRDTEWSTWDYDHDVAVTETDPWWTYHCAPQFVAYVDPNVEVASHSDNWTWSRELWWLDTMVSVSDGAPEKKFEGITSITESQEFGNGFIWIRPDEDTRPYTEANNYTEFTLVTGGMDFAAGLKALPYFYFLIPTIDDPWTYNADSGVVSHVRNPFVTMHAMSFEQSATAGKFAYSNDVQGADSAIGGLVLMVIDGASLQTQSIAYSIGNDVGSVPNTTGFGAAQFSLDTQVQALEAFTAESAGVGQGRMRGVIAAFGGTLASGQLSADLWFGAFGGIDQEGTPFFTWTKAPTQSGLAPAARTGAGMAYDKNANRLLVFGGMSANNAPAMELWSYDLGSQTWSLLNQSFFDLGDFVVTQGGTRIFIAGGKTSDGTVNTKLYMLSLVDASISEIGDLGRGPGARTGISLAYAASRAGKLLVFGGADANGVTRTDVWEYDIASKTWSQRVTDCATGTCPSGTASLLVTNKQGIDLGVYSAGRTGNEMFFVATDAGEWAAASSLAEKTPTQDCNADGVLDPESSRACRVSDIWYAPVERQVCGAPGSGEETMCFAEEPEPMTEIASWQPDGWEWIVDMAPGPDGYTYIVTDGALYTFDSRDAAEGLEPLDVDEFGCWSGADWGIDAEVVGGYLYVGAWSGVHVFSLDDPENPQEVEYAPSYGPVLDMASLENTLYLADGRGITVVDISDPSAPVEAKRVSLGTKLALRVGIDEETRGLLALTPATLERFDVRANSANPVFATRRSLLGILITEMKVDGRWAYFNGLLSTETVFWNGQTLAKKGQHDLREWVNGRVLRNGKAERTRPLYNEYEVWAE